MRRAARLFFHLAAGVSGVLFLAAVGFWVASYGSRYALMVYVRNSARDIAVSRGEVGITWTTYSDAWGPVGDPDIQWAWQRGRADAMIWDGDYIYPDNGPPVAGFLFGKAAAPDVTGFFLIFPVAVLAALFALLPLADVILIRRRRRRGRRLAAGLCVACGYDLRATPDRCPECGPVERRDAPARSPADRSG